MTEPTKISLVIPVLSVDMSQQRLADVLGVSDVPRGMVLRTFGLNHLIHHRAILRIYLRLNDIAVPGMYDPS